MALATQCPHCQTTFKVAHDQLKLRAGLVRCGACKQIFNGIEHLVPPDQLTVPAVGATPDPAAAFTPASPDRLISPTDPAVAADDAVAAPEDSVDSLEFTLNDDPETQTRILAPPSEKQPPAAPDADEEDPLTRMTLVDFTAFDLDEYDLTPAPLDKLQAPPPAPAPSIWPYTQEDFAQADAPTEATSDAVEYLRQPLADAPEKHKPGTEARVTEPVPVEDFFDIDIDDDEPAAAANQDAADMEEPGFVTRSRRRQRMNRITRMFMVIASGLLVLGLVGQAIYAFRNQLAAWFPEAKSELAQFCRLVGCQIKLPAQIDMVSIESHELQALAANKNVFALTLLLRNRSAVTQAWPTIELTLNDNNEKPLVRRMLAPRDYLASEMEAAKGFAAQSEQPVRVLFELPQLTASGYRVYLFYP